MLDELADGLGHVGNGALPGPPVLDDGEHLRGEADDLLDRVGFGPAALVALLWHITGFLDVS